MPRLSSIIYLFKICLTFIFLYSNQIIKTVNRCKRLNLHSVRDSKCGACKLGLSLSSLTLLLSPLPALSQKLYSLVRGSLLRIWSGRKDQWKSGILGQPAPNNKNKEKEKLYNLKMGLEISCFCSIMKAASRGQKSN